MEGVEGTVPRRTGVTVAYDSARLSPREIAERVTRETGYRASAPPPPGS
jgi:hypothetical protein